MEWIYWDVGGWPLESGVEETRKLTKQPASPMEQSPDRHAEPVGDVGERAKPASKLKQDRAPAF